ncbi:NUDIX domain-containing protein [Pontibacillus yanchengensis]|uniref:NUDIX domain-containing protein n=2 Tax=Pontibacillus yanchengensis TaxID=462910 RepID=A0ACC7VLB3_9BACI|nr:NUDIX domain-containing protein [Pontibacillus yanchengensis]MYL55006.1 NUDIX domain-containing protein [Pontibacillus yanchengensis]
MNDIKELRKLVGTRPLQLGAAGVLVLNEKKEILLMKRMEDKHWCIPGGIVEMGERVEETAMREVYEETKLHIHDMEFFKVYSGEQQHHIYPNGDEVYFVNVVFISSSYTGSPLADEVESEQVGFFDLAQLPEPILPTNKGFFEDLRHAISKE